ncbi:MAG: protein-L-isoaspartate O-methyltransferase [Candidatus Raymondbacteria bacterium RIFOXYD12_FULL_49_13]|uniref:Protein-L-isoaspartate O-methyltransferase n=1 Tax=Candidatus Raymondbacteria bacterium RIFOXYD12_FULL_49_13 TaxID=1817890 RepID=A0A1F7F5D6_UNCRA|nr:MAG: protein-L-isoaspartate O-methyltransferase [Candidatus Raymondbacteria bacterium RIFOXYD12_FULL_49_13]
MDFRIARQNMVRDQIMRRGIHDDRLITVMLEVPRHEFVDSGMKNQSYSDNALPIGEGQTISQPYMVAHMTDMLAVGQEDRVLEIGTGCGYQTAILAKLGASVCTIERIASLSERAQKNCAQLGLSTIEFRIGDGTGGGPEKAPFDKIITTAGAPAIPETLFSQLAEGGRMVVPVGNRSIQELLVVEKKNGEKRVTQTIDCLFVPLIGKEGWE